MIFLDTAAMTKKRNHHCHGMNDGTAGSLYVQHKYVYTLCHDWFMITDGGLVYYW